MSCCPSGEAESLVHILPLHCQLDLKPLSPGSLLDTQIASTHHVVPSLDGRVKLNGQFLSHPSHEIYAHPDRL